MHAARSTTQSPLRPAGLVHKPQSYATVAGGKGDQDARIGAGTQHQMGCDLAFAHEVVGIEAFVNFEV